MLRNIIWTFLPYVFLQHILTSSNVSVGSLSLQLIQFNAGNKEIQQFYSMMTQRQNTVAFVQHFDCAYIFQAGHFYAAA
jgi:hypothetical protein